MKDTEANVHLIRTMMRDLEQFIDENDPANFASDEEMKSAFFRFLERKHARNAA